MERILLNCKRVGGEEKERGRGKRKDKRKKEVKEEIRVYLEYVTRSSTAPNVCVIRVHYKTRNHSFYSAE